MTPRITLAGNNLAAIYVLELLLEALPPDHVLVVAPPDQQRAPWHASLSAAGRDRGVETFQPVDAGSDEAIARIVGHQGDLLLSVYFTQVFRRPLLDALRGPALNFHPSLLPRHRGVAPVVWAIVEGDDYTGVTVHHIDEGVDTGPIVCQSKMPIHPCDTGYRLHLKTARLVRSCAATLLRPFLHGVPIPGGHPQQGSATVHRRAESVNHVCWEWPVERIRNVVRALAPPLDGAFVLSAGQQVTLSEVSVLPCPAGPTKPPGTVELGRDQRPVVWGVDGLVRIDRCRESAELAPRLE
jgi:methionyl-tRNA formyltransferase